MGKKKKTYGLIIWKRGEGGEVKRAKYKGDKDDNSPLPLRIVDTLIMFSFIFYHPLVGLANPENASV